MKKLYEIKVMMTGVEAGHKAGFAEGERRGIEYGKSIGLNEGKAIGISEGKAIGISEGKTIGISEGKAIGKKEKQKEIAKKMLELKMPIEQIKEITDLSKEEINQLLN